MWRLFKYAFWLALTALLLGPFVLAAMMFEAAPRITGDAKIAVEDVERLKTLLKQNDPRDLREGETRRIELSQRDINLGVEYVLSRLPLVQGAVARTEVAAGHATVEASLPTPGNPFGQYCNLSMRLRPAARGVAVDALRVGRVPVPGWLLGRALELADGRARDIAGYREASDVAQAISEVDFRPGAVAFVMQWHGDLARRVERQGRELVLPAEERARLQVHYEELARILSNRLKDGDSLVYLLRPMFSYAADRSEDGNDPAKENKAAMVALALYAAAAPEDLGRLFGDEEARGLTPLKAVEVTLDGRADLARHFLVSGALSAAANDVIADVIGVFKEVQDSRGGSGFSFADLAADRAGVRFGQLAVRSPDALQQRVAAAAEEREFMPSVGDLPEGMQEPEFIRRFSNRDSSAYAEVVAEIESRLDRCVLFR
ncbi:MAG: hypothetical protein HONDAALG_00602 [Gammaproteobacteria bacterium]|nr:hypothetical protein [Gammaproteobacteria bacterium]